MRHNNYPYIGYVKHDADTELIVLFTAPDTGVALAPDEEFGDFQSDWTEEVFTAMRYSESVGFASHILALGYSDNVNNLGL